MDLPQNLQNRDGSKAWTGSLPVEGHSDAQVSMRGSVGQQFFENWSNGESFFFAYLPLEKKTPLFFYRTVPVTAVMRSGVVAVVPLHRSVLVTAIVGDGVMVVVE